MSQPQEAIWQPVLHASRLGDQLFQRLVGLIEQGQFAEGSRLPAESDLAERFGVSRPVVREALGRLRMIGMIMSRKGSGSFVCRRADRVLDMPAVGLGHMDSLARVRKCYEFRIGLEGEAAFNAAHYRSAEALQTLLAALKRIEAAIVGGVVGMDADHEFHLAVARATGNEFYITMMETMRAPIEFCINLGRSLSMHRPYDHLLRVQQEHVTIFKAIEAGDGETARDAMRQHVADACERIFHGPDNAKVLAENRLA
jgi:GntR family transcriptional repressor for pyruvate dehydrogenase complex